MQSSSRFEIVALDGSVPTLPVNIERVIDRSDGTTQVDVSTYRSKDDCFAHLAGHPDVTNLRVAKEGQA